MENPDTVPPGIAGTSREISICEAPATAVAAPAPQPPKETRRERIARKQCEQAAREAKNKGWAVDPLLVFDRYQNPTSLRDLWRGSAAFLVCGGPSLNDNPLEAFKDRGIVSLGVNNVAAHAHVKAMVFSDPPSKFHGGVWLDPSIIKFCPMPKLEKKYHDHKIRLKIDGKFQTTELYPEDCPGVVGFKRGQELEPETFLTSDAAHWGRNKKYHLATGKPKILFTFFLGLRLLYYLGVRRIFLVGVDFSMAQGGYAFGQGRTAGAVSSNQNHYALAPLICNQLKPHFEAAGLEVFNTNQHSRLTTWEYLPFREAYDHCRKLLPPEPYDTAHWYEKAAGFGSVPDGVNPAEWLAEKERERKGNVQ